MNVVLTGNQGFIGKNLEINLSVEKGINLYLLNRKTSKKNIKIPENCDVLIHAAGVNRPKKKILIRKIIIFKELVKFMDKKKEKKIIFFSTSKVNEKSEYGLSKKGRKFY